jgi:ABC-2 type transport system ATP-binding protein
MTPAIETHELTKRFRPVRPMRAVMLGRRPEPDRVAVDAVSLSIGRGEVFGLLGQNGAGKTTLVRMLTTLLVPTSGTASVDGIDVIRDARGARARIGLINGDERSFYWRLTGRQNLEFFAALRQLDARSTTDAIDRLAARLGMAQHLDRPFGRLSSGQRQALAIVRGLLDSPAIVFMDEPTRSLDPISAARLRRFVAEVIVGELGRTVVLATHSMVEAEELCTRLAFLQDGRIAALGTVDDLRRATGYGTRCDLRLRDAPADVAAMVGGIDGVHAVKREVLEPPTADGATVAVHLTMSSAGALAEILRVLVRADVAVLACETSEPSLEEIYVRTLGGTPDAAPSVVAVPVR